MEKKRAREQGQILISELNQGRELTEQLKNQIHLLESPELCENLIQKIISIYEKSISMLNLGDSVGENHHVSGIFGSTDRQCLAGISQRNEASDQFHNDIHKKRKIMPRWTEKVQVNSGTGQGPPDDGHSWRKYGQKEILGATFPRAYFRCTHRNTQGCLATKQVQRSDEDPSILLITYRDKHTCILSSQLNPFFEVESKVPKQNRNQSQSLKSEEMGFVEDSFSFLPILTESENNETGVFLESFLENDYLKNSEFEMEYDLTQETISATTSATNSPTGNLDFSFDQVELDPDFSFDTSVFFA